MPSEIKLDLHDIFSNSRGIDEALHSVMQEAIDKHAEYVEIIPGKGSGALKKRGTVYVPGQIADKFKVDVPVIVNLQGSDTELAKRLIDFGSGLTYALDGGMQRTGERRVLHDRDRMFAGNLPDLQGHRVDALGGDYLPQTLALAFRPPGHFENARLVGKITRRRTRRA